MHFKNSLNLLDYKNLTHIGSEQINKLLSLISFCEIKDNNINILDFGGGAGHHYFLLKKLQQTKGSLTYKELADYLEYNVKKESGLSGKIQTPQVNVSSSVANSWGSWSFR